MVTNTHPRMDTSCSSNPRDHWAKKPGRRRLWPRIQNRTDGVGQGCPYHPFSARDYVCPGYSALVDRRHTTRSEVTMKFIEFLVTEKGSSFLRAVPSSKIQEIVEKEDGTCLLKIENQDGRIVSFSSSSAYRTIWCQLNGTESLDIGEVFGIRAKEIVAVQEGTRGCVEIVLRNGITLTRSDMRLHEILAAWTCK